MKVPPSSEKGPQFPNPYHPGHVSLFSGGGASVWDTGRRAVRVEINYVWNPGVRRADVLQPPGQGRAVSGVSAWRL